MKIDSTYKIALSGVQRGLAGLRRDAAQLASAKQMRGETDSVQPLVDLSQNRLQVEANVKVMRAADSMLGSLLDEKA